MLLTTEHNTHEKIYIETNNNNVGLFLQQKQHWIIQSYSVVCED